MLEKPIARRLAVALLLVASPAFASNLLADGGHAHGSAAKASEASRTIDVTLYDNYYEPESIAISAGETIRFRLKNEGELLHEFAIGTAAMHQDHQAEMQMMVDHGVLEATRVNLHAAQAMQSAMGHGMHDEPNIALLEPGQSAEMVWMFPASGSLEFACNIPGHYDAGMVGAVRLK